MILAIQIGKVRMQRNGRNRDNDDRKKDDHFCMLKWIKIIGKKKAFQLRLHRPSILIVYALTMLRKSDMMLLYHIMYSLTCRISFIKFTSLSEINKCIIYAGHFVNNLLLLLLDLNVYFISMYKIL